MQHLFSPFFAAEAGKYVKLNFSQKTGVAWNWNEETGNFNGFGVKQKNKCYKNKTIKMNKMHLTF